MARKPSKAKRQQSLEDALVNVMIATTEDYRDFTYRLGLRVSEAVLRLSLLLMDENSSSIARNEAIAELYSVLDDYREEFIQKLRETSEKALSDLSGQDYFGRVLYTAEQESTLENTLEEAYDYFEEIFIPIMFELVKLSNGSQEDRNDKALGATLAQLSNNLEYFLRRHVEAQMSLIINLTVIGFSEPYGVELWKWNNRPELTESGTCDHCKSLANGGIRDEGIYTLDTLPLLPVHPHCVCIIIPLIP